jgi:hypothetical protein
MKARIALLAVLTCLILAASAHAGPVSITLTDPYGSSATQYSGSGNPNSFDVIGSKDYWDIEKIIFTINGSAVTADIRFNRNDNTNLTTPITLATYNLFAGDLLFGTSPGSYQWGVSLSGHHGLTAGYLYGITGVYTSDALPTTSNTPGSTANPHLPASGSGVVYRTVNNAVWMNPTGATQLSTGSLSVTKDTPSLPGKEISVLINFTATGSFLTELQSNGLDVHFAAATCANDVLDGTIPAQSVPEPTSIILLGGGLLGLGFLRFRKARKN